MGKRPEWWLSVLAKIWPLTWISARATHWPVIGPVVGKMTLPLFSGDNLNITYIPIHRPLEPFQSTPLPIRVGEELIRRASHRVIIHRCTCRDARQCVNHPIDLGCMLLGPGAAGIDPRIARHVSDHMMALELADSGIRHNALRCKGCGRCLTVCPEQAIGIDVEDVDAAVDELVTRIRRRIELT